MRSLSWQLQARSAFYSFLNFFLPPVCANCKKVGASICQECLEQITWLQEPICHQCGRVTPHPTETCSACCRQPLPLTQIRTAVLFTGPLPPIIHHLKYKNGFGLAEPLANLMVNAWKQWQTPIDLVIPIPLHQERLKHRGYNQSHLLAQHFCQQLHLPENQTCLKRIKHTQPQVNLNASERLLNVKDAFSADPHSVQQKEVLLVDDVCTTGATLAAAANALLKAGAHSVSAYCLARAT